VKNALLILAGVAGAAFGAPADDLAGRQSPEGELILTQLVSAPFPHPQRAEGHRYGDQVFAAKEHYSDSTVAIFIPRGFRETGRIDFVVHFHGWQNNVTNVLRRYRLIEQLRSSGRNAVLVVPQGPRDASDSFGGKLEDPGGFKRFIEEVAQVLRDRPGAKRKDFGVGTIVLSGHSGGYHVISAILDRGGLASHIKEVWLFDALYGQTDKFLAWLDQYHGRLLDIYTQHGGTKEETEQLMALLQRRGTAFYAGQESETETADLRKSRPVFLFSRLEHDAVVAEHGTFRTFLETSALERVSNE
jgi:hypothetical protein